MREFVVSKKGDDVIDDDSGSGNTECSAGGIVVFGQKVLLVHQRRTTSWTFPKGHIEDGESEIEAARREVLEETGLGELAFLRSLGSYTRRTNRDPNVVKHITMFLFTTDREIVAPTADDVVACDWLSADDAMSRLTYPEDIAFFRGVLDKIVGDS